MVQEMLKVPLVTVARFLMAVGCWRLSMAQIQALANESGMGLSRVPLRSEWTNVRLAVIYMAYMNRNRSKDRYISLLI